MQVTKDHAARHSEQDFGKDFLMLVDSGAGVIHVRAPEILRAVSCLRKTILLDKGEYHEWDIVNGMRTFTLDNYTDEAVLGDGNIDLSAAFQSPLAAMRGTASDSSTKFFVFQNPHVFMADNPHMHQLLLVYNEYLPSCRVCVVLVTPDIPLPDSAANSNILAINFHTPGLLELRASLQSIIKDSSADFPDGADVDEKAVERICYSGAGMCALQFETYVSLGAVKAAKDGDTALTAEAIQEEVARGKTDIVNSSDILELYPSTSISDVGGMENLKQWVRRRSACYSDEAKEFGVEAPKGLVLVGVPGSGKSLVAKAIAGTLGIPLVRMDFGKVFSSLVGSSEQRIRQALRQVEAMSPVCLFADEIDKGLGGIANGSGGDSGVSMRVLGSFLTWLQDCSYPVFTIVTANNVDGLPPELLRRGRFDAIFSTSLPTPRERREVLEIHLRKRGRSIKSFSSDEIAAIVDASDGYVPSEIESAVKDGLVNSFSDEEEFSARHIIEALGVMVPLSKAFEQQIKKMTEWARNNATPVSLSDEERAERVAQTRNRTRVSARRRV